MLSADEASKEVETAIPGVKVEACVPYKGGYLARVVLPDPEEANYDPIFVINANTGEVVEFNILLDGDIAEVAAAFGIEAPAA